MLSDPQKNKINDTKYQDYVLNKMCLFFSKKTSYLFLKKNIKSFSQECVTTSLSLIDSSKVNERQLTFLKLKTLLFMEGHQELYWLILFHALFVTLLGIKDSYKYEHATRAFRSIVSVEMKSYREWSCQKSF